MTATIGWKNLLHDPVRALTALAGVVFAVVLVVLQVGILVGSMKAASAVIDHSRADLWVTSPNADNFDFGHSIPERRYYQVLGTPGVARAERMILAWGQWDTHDGRQQSVLVVGLEPDARLAGPWEVVEGDPSLLRSPGGIAIDERERGRYGRGGRALGLGDEVEINGRRATVVAFTRGVGSFTTIPYVFATLDNAVEYLNDFGPDRVSYVLATASPGVDPAVLAARLSALPEVEVLTTREYSDRTRRYWIIDTGMGAGLILTAALGLVVGTVIVSQTIYAMTVEKRREFGTLKALGYSAGSLARIVLVQAAILGAAGYVVGLGASDVVQGFAQRRGVTVELSPEIAAGAAVLTALVCTIASLSSIWRLAGMEPAMVFRE